MKRYIISLVFVLLALTGCDTGLRQMGATEYGVIFRKLPPFVGGGISHKVVPQAKKVIVWPWDELYRFDTSERYVSWGAKDAAGNQRSDDGEDRGFVYTRALDGNEVALAVTVVFRVQPDSQKLLALIERGTVTNDGVRDLVIAVGRSDIRTHMNKLKTVQFADAGERYRAVSEVQSSMNRRLSPYGIEVMRVTLDNFQFERLLRDGTIDNKYQEKLSQIQQLNEDTSRERTRLETIKAKKEREYADVQGEVNRISQEAEGYKNQATLRADAYYSVRANEAEAILAKGKAEVEGLTQQVQALSGPGGEAILKIELVKQLLKSDPRFVVLNTASESGGQAGIDLRKLDTNQLLKQLGVTAAVASSVNEPGVIEPGSNQQNSQK